jgi:cytochrome P450
MVSNSAPNSPIFDPFTPEFQADPFPVLRRLREEDPIHRSPLGWVLTRYDDVVAALRSHSLVAADPSLLPALVEECLRYDPSVTATPRRAREDTTIGGTRIAAGDRLVLSISGANRDPARFPDPDRFEIGRPDNEPVAFGGGVHYCLGAALARAEAQIVFGTLLRRYPKLELASQSVQWRDNWIFRGPVTLHVSL